MTTDRRPPRTRFAPAPTGYLHLGHVANAIFVWGLAGPTAAASSSGSRTTTGSRSRPEFDAALLEDLAWLGFVAGRGPGPPVATTTRRTPAALERLRADEPRLRLRLHADDVRGLGARPRPARGTGRAARAGAAPRGLAGPVAAGRARRRLGALDGPPDRAVRGRGGRRRRRPAGPRPRRPLDVRRSAVVVDDLRQGVDLVVRGRDLLRRHAGPDPAGPAARPRRRRRRSRITRSSAAPTAASCRRPTARPAVRELRAAGRRRAGAHRTGGRRGRPDRGAAADRGGRAVAALFGG